MVSEATSDKSSNPQNKDVKGVTYTSSIGYLTSEVFRALMGEVEQDKYGRKGKACELVFLSVRSAGTTDVFTDKVVYMQVTDKVVENGFELRFTGCDGVYCDYLIQNISKMTISLEGLLWSIKMTTGEEETRDRVGFSLVFGLPKTKAWDKDWLVAVDRL